MDYKQLTQLSALPEQELTARLVGLFGHVLQYHDAGRGLEPFYWQDLTMEADGTLSLGAISETELTEEVRYRNYFDCAAIIYCVCTREQFAGSMELDAGSKIVQPVLREIVLTICGRNYSIEPLIARLHEPYVDADTFFRDYSTVDAKEAAEAERAGEECEQEADAPAMPPEPKPWYRSTAWYILGAICIIGHQVYRAEQRNRESIRFEQMLQRTRGYDANRPWEKAAKPRTLRAVPPGTRIKAPLKKDTIPQEDRDR